MVLKMIPPVNIFLISVLAPALLEQVDLLKLLLPDADRIAVNYLGLPAVLILPPPDPPSCFVFVVGQVLLMMLCKS